MLYQCGLMANNDDVGQRRLVIFGDEFGIKTTQLLTLSYALVEPYKMILVCLTPTRE